MNHSRSGLPAAEPKRHSAGRKRASRFPQRAPTNRSRSLPSCRSARWQRAHLEPAEDLPQPGITLDGCAHRKTRGSSIALSPRQDSHGSREHAIRNRTLPGGLESADRRYRNCTSSIRCWQTVWSVRETSCRHRRRSSRALDHDPNFWEALNGLGNLLARQGKVGPAIALYRRALAVAPDQAAVHHNLAHALAVREILRNPRGSTTSRFDLIRGRRAHI